MTLEALIEELEKISMDVHPENPEVEVLQRDGRCVLVGSVRRRGKRRVRLVEEVSE